MDTGKYYTIQEYKVYKGTIKNVGQIVVETRAKLGESLHLHYIVVLQQGVPKKPIHFWVQLPSKSYGPPLIANGSPCYRTSSAYPASSGYNRLPG